VRLNAKSARGSSTRPARRAPRLALNVQYGAKARGLPSAAELRRFARAALKCPARVTVRIVGRNEARALNRHFRGRNYPTNVLTFVMRDTAPLEGDLALCAPVIAREARTQGKSMTAHYAHLVVHGLLHLQGYEHETAREASAMESLESRILMRLGYPDPYSVRRKT